MTAPLKLGIQSAQELSLLRMLARGVIDFKDLSSEEKLMLYESTIDIRPMVDEEVIREFEEEMSLNNAIENDNSIRALVAPIANRIRGRLEA